MPSTFRVALAQTSPRNAPPSPDERNLLQTVEDNLLEIAEYASKAKEGGADVVVCPEYFVGGLVEGKEYLVHPSPHALEYLRAVCRSLSISLVGTLVEPQDLPSSALTGEPTASPFAHLPIPSIGSVSATTLLQRDELLQASWRTFLENTYPHCFSKGSALKDVSTEKTTRLAENPDQKDVPSTSLPPAVPNVPDPKSILSSATDLAQTLLSSVQGTIADLRKELSEEGKAERVGTSALGERPLLMSNTAYFIDAEGNVAGSYRKKNLWIPERDYLVAGADDHAVFDTPFAKAGLLICWDLSRPQAAAKLANAGADIIFAPTYWMGFDSEPGIKSHSPPKDYERELLRSLAYTRAFETETAVIMVNPGASSTTTSPDGDGFIGGSGVWLPFKGLLGEVPRSESGIDREGLQFVDVDLGVLRDSRNTYQIRQDKLGNVGSM